MSTSVPIQTDEVPPFREPWQAKAFALVVLLHRNGHFPWEEWVQTLSAEISALPQRADEDAESAYHRQFLAALEKIVVRHGLTTAEGMQDRTLAWRRAYRNTPHGHAVDLAAAGTGHADDDHDHDHDDAPEHDLRPQVMPLAISGRRR